MKRMKLVTNELLKKAVWGEKEVLWEADRIERDKYFDPIRFGDLGDEYKRG